jgi:hypothetical protein
MAAWEARARPAGSQKLAQFPRAYERLLRPLRRDAEPRAGGTSTKSSSATPDPIGLRMTRKSVLEMHPGKWPSR